jgi:uroporphyrinogen-III synthase
MRLLVTRPEEEGARTGAALRARGHEVLLAPLLRIETIEAAIDDAVDHAAYGAVVMTSANAARALAAHPRRAGLVALPAFTVGRRTAETARAMGFAEVHSADGDKTDLAALIRAQYAGARGPLLYLAGEDRAGELDLGPGVTVITAVIYRATAVECFPAALDTALMAGHIDGVLHFSRRTAEAYLACARGGLRAPALAPRHFCLSRAVAEPLASAGAAAIRIAARPDEAAMLELVRSE